MKDNMSRWPTQSRDLDPAITHLSAHDSATAAVVSAVADARTLDPEDVDSLYDTVDPDALNALFSDRMGVRGIDLELTFTIADCRVILYGDGRVIASPIAVATRE